MKSKKGPKIRGLHAIEKNADDTVLFRARGAHCRPGCIE
jgi:hypothetical protein